MEERGCIVLAFRDTALGGAVKRTLMAHWGRPVESFEDMASAESRVIEGGVDLLVIGPGLADRGALDSSISGGLMEDRASVLVIADEEGWPDGVALLPVGHTPGQLEQALESILHRRGSLEEKAYIEKFSGYVVPVEALQESVIHEDGSWSREVAGGLVEVGVDIRRWLNEGKLLCVEHIDVSSLQSGKPYARLFSGDGTAHTLVAPLSGRIMEKNSEANGAVCVLSGKCASEGWSLWLLRLEPS